MRWMHKRAEARSTEESMTDKNEKAMDRRSFFRAVGGASTVAQAYDPGGDETKARYRESDHVKAFYRTNGYETLKK